MTGFISKPTVTRAANTTAYTAGDVVGGVITFAGLGNVSGHILITSADLRINVTAIPSGMTSFRLHLYTSSPASALADNDAFDIPAGDRTAYIGYIDLGSVTDWGNTLFTQVDSLNKHVAVSGSAPCTLYGYLQTVGGFTPAANSEVYVPCIRAIAL